MKKNFVSLVALFSLSLLLFSCCDDDGTSGGGGGDVHQEFAFPGAEGAGKYTQGGRGEQGREGAVIAVISLDDSGPGTLRAALAVTGKKMIVFKVAGIIELASPLIIGNDVTILGHSAPGDGICIKNYPVEVRGSNVIIRFLRFRMGDEAIDNPNFQAGDALTVGARTNNQGIAIIYRNIIIDHCSFSWSMDECLSAYDIENFTLQYSIISESLKASGHPKGNHGYGGIWGGRNVTFHHNLLAHHDSRNPRFNGDRFTAVINNEKVDYRNNVIYNWGGNSAYAAEGGYYNIVNNYYKPGPTTMSKSESVQKRILNPDSNPMNSNYFDSRSPLWAVLRAQNPPKSGLWGNFYISGNYMYGNSDVTTDNWNGGVQPSLATSSSQPAGSNRYLLETRDAGLTTASVLEMIRLQSEVQFDNSITLHSAQNAYDAVLDFAGASLKRDAVDERVTNEVRNNDGRLIDSQSEVGAWPVYNATEILQDTDSDGIPDVWEIANGLNPNLRSDATRRSSQNPAYTNLEVYLEILLDAQGVFPQ